MYICLSVSVYLSIIYFPLFLSYLYRFLDPCFSFCLIILVLLSITFVFVSFPVSIFLSINASVCLLFSAFLSPYQYPYTRLFLFRSLDLNYSCTSRLSFCFLIIFRLCISLYQPLCLYLSAFLSPYQFPCTIYLSVCPSVCLSVQPSLNQNYLSLYLSSIPGRPD